MTLLSLDGMPRAKFDRAGSRATPRWAFVVKLCRALLAASRFRLSTRAREAVEGTEILVNGGKIGLSVPMKRPALKLRCVPRFTLPARRKFLRSENTEASHVHHQLSLQAIGHPKIGFVSIRDQNIMFQAPPAESLAERIRDLRGSELFEQLLEIQSEPVGGITISGFLGRAGVSRSTKAEQVLIVNGRPVENITIQHGLREGYHTAMMKGQYAVTFLFLEMDPEAVDVNVHPAKREVRFREPDAVRNAVAETIRKTLETDRGRWSQAFRKPVQTAKSSEPEEQVRLTDPLPALIPASEQFALRRDWAEFHSIPPGRSSVPPSLPVVTGSILPSDGPAIPAENPNFIAKSASEFNILGVLGKLYILMENAEGLVLVDQHAAHELILFEKLRRDMESEGVPTQRLLIPLTVNVTPKDYDWITTNAPTLERMGFALEPFGNSTLKIDGIPQFFRTDDPSVAVRQLVDELRSMTTTTSRLRMGEDVIAKTVCRHAIKANDDLRRPEVENLLRDLMSCELPHAHSRPTMIQIGYGGWKKFGRKA
jgi:DNA mismatch repair protein MutL